MTSDNVWALAWKNRRLWLYPMLLVIVLIGGLLLFTEGARIAPFVYAVF